MTHALCVIHRFSSWFIGFDERRTKIRKLWQPFSFLNLTIIRWNFCYSFGGVKSIVYELYARNGPDKGMKFERLWILDWTPLLHKLKLNPCLVAERERFKNKRKDLTERFIFKTSVETRIQTTYHYRHRYQQNWRETKLKVPICMKGLSTENKMTQLNTETRLIKGARHKTVNIGLGSLL